MKTKLKELDPEKIKQYGKLTDNEDDLSKLVFIKKEKTRLIYNKFKTRRNEKDTNIIYPTIL